LHLFCNLSCYDSGISLMTENNETTEPSPPSKLSILFQQAKPYFLGFITPVLLWILILLFSPAFLIHTPKTRKSIVDAVVLECNGPPTKQRLITAASLYKRKKVKRIILVMLPIHPKNLPAGLDENYEDKSFYYLVNRGVLPEMVDITVGKEEKLFSIKNIRVLARLLVTTRVNSILLQTDPFDSAYSRKMYLQVLSPLKIEVDTVFDESTYTVSTWFTSFAGIGYVQNKIFNFLQYKLSGTE
jgi:hypothetical protein